MAGRAGGPPVDDKDWTWVITAACPECGFDPASIRPSDIATRTRDFVPRWLAVLARADVRARPAPATWSSLEYAAHVRDVFTTFTARARLMLAEEDPLFQNWDQDATALQKRYWEGDPVALAAELAAAAEETASVFDGVPGGGWDRPGRRSNGSAFTLASLGTYLLHDVSHHLHDVSG